MAAIIIKELYDSDTISELVEKSNFNWDQIIAGGGGPEGPAGPDGPEGPAGIQGIRGSQWFADNGSGGEINVPTDGVLRENDFRLEDDGGVQYYDNGWIDTGLNLTGPQGPQGNAGDGSIAVIHSEATAVGGYIIPNETVNSKLKLSSFLVGIDDNNDSDDDALGAPYLNSGLDYIVVGHGNNSMVLGRYASMFNTNGDLKPFFDNWPKEQADVPMLIVAQNDYKDPQHVVGFDPDLTFDNGLAIGLNLTHSDYADWYKDVPEFGDYSSFTQLRTKNRNFDFNIKSPGHIELESRGTNLFRLSSGYSRNSIQVDYDINEWSNRLAVDTYFNLASGDNIVLDHNTTQDPNQGTSYKEVIINTGRATIQSNYEHPEIGKAYDTLNTTVFSRNSFPTSNAVANEIAILNDNGIDSLISTSRYNGRQGSNIQDSTQIYNNVSDLRLKFGQTRLNVSSSNLESIDNLFYLGQGYDTPIVGYSSTNFRIPNVFTGLGATGSANSLIPSRSEDLDYLGYNILDPISNGQASETEPVRDKSMARLGIFPGFFNQQVDAEGNPDPNDPDSRENLKSYLDFGHKILPTGSLDLYGTVRIREYGLANEKEGYVAVNGGYGAVKWEDPTKVGVPTGAIVMVSEYAMESFNFVSYSNIRVGDPTLPAAEYDEITFRRRRNTSSSAFRSGSTGYWHMWSGAFPGKGFDKWAGYYICSGAVLADTRDIYARGFFSRSGGGVFSFGSDKQIPGLSINEHFDKYEWFGPESPNPATRYKWVVGAGNIWEIGNTYSQYRNILFNRINNLSREISAQSTGLSLLAPSIAESRFRVILPNYFGRFPKQQFPSSNYLRYTQVDPRKSLDAQGRKLPTVDRLDALGTGYFKPNDRWVFNSAFTAGGFPYIRRDSLPNHQHWLGNKITIKSGSGSSYNVMMPDSGTIPDTGNNDMSGFPGWGGNSRAIDGPNEYYLSWDHSTRRSSTYWPEEVVDAMNARSQRIAEPVFRGTYFAINLRGMTNPNMNDTLIPDFDFVQGVPVSGYKNTEGADGSRGGIDLSWYSSGAMINQWSSRSLDDLSNLSTSYYSRVTTAHIPPTDNYVGSDNITYIGWNSTFDIDGYDFIPIYRNEAHSHQFTAYAYTDDDASYTQGTEDLTELYRNIYTNTIVKNSDAAYTTSNGYFNE